MYSALFGSKVNIFKWARHILIWSVWPLWVGKKCYWCNKAGLPQLFIVCIEWINGLETVVFSNILCTSMAKGISGLIRATNIWRQDSQGQFQKFMGTSVLDTWNLNEIEGTVKKVKNILRSLVKCFSHLSLRTVTMPCFFLLKIKIKTIDWLIDWLTWDKRA